MRITFLFEPSQTDSDGLGPIVEEWCKGLAEGQYRIQVITRQNCEPRENPHGNLQWAQAMKNWSWLELPKLYSLILNANPQLVHLILGRPPKPWSLWPGLSALKTFHIPLVVTCADSIHWPKGWRFHDQMLGPRECGHFAVPGLGHLDFSTEIQDGSVFVPGPLTNHADWRESLRQLMRLMQSERPSKMILAWDWSEIPLPERLKWREQWQQSCEKWDLIYAPDFSLAEQRRQSLSCEFVRTDLLRRPGWQWAGWTSRQPLDSAINHLARAYRSVIESAHVPHTP